MAVARRRGRAGATSATGVPKAPGPPGAGGRARGAPREPGILGGSEGRASSCRGGQCAGGWRRGACGPGRGTAALAGQRGIINTTQRATHIRPQSASGGVCGLLNELS